MSCCMCVLYDVFYLELHKQMNDLKSLLKVIVGKVPCLALMPIDEALCTEACAKQANVMEE